MYIAVLALLGFTSMCVYALVQESGWLYCGPADQALEYFSNNGMEFESILGTGGGKLERGMLDSNNM